ncbi:MAG: O-antigen ligase family protein [Terriglobales bacterium]
MLPLYGLLALLGSAVCAFGAVQPWSSFGLEAGAILLFLVVLGQWVFGERSLVLAPTYAPLALMLVTAAAQLLLHRTVSSYQTGEQALLWVAYAALCVVAAQVTRQRDELMQFAVAIVIFGTALALFAVVQDLTSNGRLYWVVLPRIANSIYGPYVNHNHYAGLLEMLAPFPFVLAGLRSNAGPRRAALIFAGLVMAGSVVASGSRGGVMALGAEAIFFLLVGRKGSSGKQVLRMAILLALFGGSAFLLSRTVTMEHFSETLLNPSRDVSFSTRWNILRDCRHLVAARPVLGWGLGTFEDVYPRYQSFYAAAVMNAAHNDYAQFLVESGVIGFAAFLWLVMVVYRSGLTHLADWHERSSRAICFAAMMGVTGLLAHSWTDFNLEIPANAAVFLVLCTVVTRADSEVDPSPSKVLITMR